MHVINQTASELRLHRALYILKLIRATVLQLMLILTAGLLFVFGDIHGFYPVADITIIPIKASMDRLREVGAPLLWVVPVTALGVFLLIVGVWFWMYFAIIKVKRKSLRVQTVFWILLAVFMLATSWQKLTFSLEHLSILFSGLVMVSQSLLTLMLVDWAMALWAVSHSPERSSFTATLDPRLASGAWAYANKFLDLPRTPWRNWRTGAAYALALSGTFLLIASITYLMTFGAVAEKSQQLFSTCGNTYIAGVLVNAGLCESISSSQAREILIWMVVSLVGVRAAGLMSRRRGGWVG